MPIEHGAGGTMVTGDSINFFQLCVHKSAVGLELKGIQMTRGRRMWTTLRDYYQIPGKGKRKASIKDVHDWLSAKVEELRPVQTHISTDPTGRKVVEVEGKEVS